MGPLSVVSLVWSDESAQSFVATFRSVFPYTIAFKDRDLIMLGSRQPIRLSFQRLLERFEDPRTKGNLEKAFVHYQADLLVKLHLDEDGAEAFSQGAPINTDDNMRLELTAPRSPYKDRIELVRAEMDRDPPNVLDCLIDYESEPEMEIELAASCFIAGRDEEVLRHCRCALEMEISFAGLKLLGQTLHRKGELQEVRTALGHALIYGGDLAGRTFVRTLLSSLALPVGS